MIDFEAKLKDSLQKTKHLTQIEYFIEKNSIRKRVDEL